MEFSPEKSIGSIYLSNLNMILSNLKIILVALVALLESPKITESLSVMALLLKSGLSESLPKSCES
jgi:hypothetical protein